MSRLPLVLAIEPDLRQAAIVKRVVKERVQAELVVVDSRDAAIDAIRTAIPDVLLVSTLLSPRDEDDLIAHLRTLEGAGHLQTHTIPQLASALGRGENDGGGLFSSFRRKKQPAAAPAGCDPDLFADEIQAYLQRAAEKKRDAAENGTVTPLPGRASKPVGTAAQVSDEAPEPAPASAWESPFEWRPSNPSSFIPHPESSIPDPPIPDPVIPDAPFAELAIPDPVIPDPVIADPVPEVMVATAAEPEPVRIHVPSPLSVWARKESPKDAAPAADAEFDRLFARAGVPDGVASVGYPDGVRIRCVRVRAARESHPSLQGAVLLGKRMLAELSGNDVRA